MQPKPCVRKRAHTSRRVSPNLVYGASHDPPASVPLSLRDLPHDVNCRCADCGTLTPTLASIAAQLEQATKGPWVAGDEDDIYIKGTTSVVIAGKRVVQDANLAFIAAAPTNIAWLIGEVGRLREQVKGVACEVCWTTSWTPIEAIEEAGGVNTKLHDKTLTRCEHCWREKVYSEKLAQAEALLVALPDGAVDTLKKWYAEKQRADKAEAQLKWIRERVSCLQSGSDNVPCVLNDQPDTWCIYHYLKPQEGAR